MKPHRYNIQFVFENDELDKWQEIIIWESRNHFKGAGSMIWAEHEDEIYLFKLIKENNLTFLKETPVYPDFALHAKKQVDDQTLFHQIAEYCFDGEALKAAGRFIHPLIEHSHDLFTAKNNFNLTPLAVAVKAENVIFIKSFFSLIKKEMASDSPFSIQDLMKLFAHEMDLYTWAKTQRVSKEVLGTLRSMGADLFSPNFAKIDFQSRLPQTQNNKLYWEALTKAAISYHKLTPFESAPLYAFLHSLNYKMRMLPQNQDYYEQIDQLIFAVRMHEVLALNQGQVIRTRGFNLLKTGLEYLDLTTHYNLFTEEGWTQFRRRFDYPFTILILGLFSVGIYFMTEIFKRTRETHHKLEHELDIECKESVDCINWYLPPSDCCNNQTSSDICEDWPAAYDECYNKGQLYLAMLGLLCAFIVLGLFPSFLIARLIFPWTYQGSIMALRMLTGPVNLITDHNRALYLLLKEFIMQSKIKNLHVLPLGQDLDALQTLEKSPAKFTQDDFLHVLASVQKLISEYRFHAEYVSPTERIPLPLIEKTASELKRIVPSSTQRPLRLSDHQDIDLEERGEARRLVNHVN